MLFHNDSKGQKSKTKTRLFKVSRVLFWIVAGLLVSFFITGYLFEPLTIPTTSMNDAVETGEHVMVNKLIPGARFFPNNPNLYFRIRFKKLDYNDIVVFNFPESDTVITNRIDESYYYHKRQNPVSPEIEPSNLDYLKVSERPWIIKRVVALPGDTLLISEGNIFINNLETETLPSVVELYKWTGETGEAKKLKNINNIIHHDDNIFVELSKSQLDENTGLSEYLKKELLGKNIPDSNIFPFNAAWGWNAGYMGAVYLPRKGDTIELTPDNLILYKRMIETFENNTVELRGNTIFINSKQTATYCFKMNYFWVMGDNRSHSFDSRYWGAVPENHIVGKVR